MGQGQAVTLSCAPLEPLAFAPFGEVIDASRVEPCLINRGRTQRFDALASVQLSGPEDRALISLFHAQPYTPPVALEYLERHPLGSQAFFPFKSNGYLVVVAPDQQGRPDLEAMQVFLVTAAQGVNYYRGTWHHPLIALHEPADFLVVDRAGPGVNCEEFPLPQRYCVSL